MNNVDTIHVFSTQPRIAMRTNEPSTKLNAFETGPERRWEGPLPTPGRVERIWSALVGSSRRSPSACRCAQTSQDLGHCDCPGPGVRTLRAFDEQIFDRAPDRRFVDPFWWMNRKRVKGWRGRHVIGWICLGLAAGLVGSCMAAVSGTGEIQSAWVPGVLLLGAIATSAVGFGFLRG